MLLCLVRRQFSPSSDFRLRLQYQNDWLALSPPPELCAVDFINLSVQSSQGLPEPLLMTPQDALLSLSRPSGGLKTKKREMPRTCPFFDARTRSVLEPACGRVSSSPTARLRREESRLRLKQTTPNAAHRYPLFKSSTAFRALAPSPFFAVLETKTHVSVLERKIAPRSLFPS